MSLQYWCLFCLFSALVCFQVVVLSTRPLPIMPQRSMSEVSFVINKAERKALRDSRRSSLIGWDSSLEDVQVRWRRFLPTPSSLQSIKCFIFYHKINLHRAVIKILCPGGWGWRIWGRKEPDGRHDGSDRQWRRRQWKWWENSHW